MEAMKAAEGECRDQERSVCVAREAEIPALISRIEKQSYYLHDQVAVLESRLESVLRVPYPTEPSRSAETAEPVTQTGASLLTISQSITGAIARIENLTERLAL